VESFEEAVRLATVEIELLVNAADGLLAEIDGSQGLEIN
jgi:hypothetical protein